MTETALTPTRPYLARAIYAWICDNQLTPYLLVDATINHVQVPQQYIKDGQIVLNVAPHAVSQFQIENDAIYFSARFGGVAQDLYVPMSAVLGIYSRENGQGLFFDPQEYQDTTLAEDAASEEAAPEQGDKKKPSLRVLD
jgi:stringent starvation protein B